MKSIHESRLAYRRQLRKCGFTGWNQAQDRRHDLAVKEAFREATVAEHAELDQLQKLLRLRLNCDKGCRAEYRAQMRRSRKIDLMVRKLDSALIASKI